MRYTELSDTQYFIKLIACRLSDSTGFFNAKGEGCMGVYCIGWQGTLDTPSAQHVHVHVHSKLVCKQQMTDCTKISHGFYYISLKTHKSSHHTVPRDNFCVYDCKERADEGSITLLTKAGN